MLDLIFYLVIALLIFGFIFDQWVGHLSNNGWKKALPDLVKPIYNEEKYEEAKNYSRDNDKIAFIKSILSTLIILSILFSGAFGQLDSWVRGISENEYLQMFLFFGTLFIIADILSLPFQWYSTFVIEERYGFNKSTKKTFIIDKVKGYLIAAILGGGILALIFIIYQLTSDKFWILAWALVSLISIFMALFYTKLLLPIFNKLSPLEEGELKDAIMEVARKTDFTVQKIMIMDGSKRSSKANAFFSGWGKQKSIVLYDTLIDQHETDEMLAVLAHEIGHYKKKHIPKSMILGLLQSLLTFFILGIFLNYPELSKSIGFNEGSFYASLILFSILYSPLELILGIFTNMYSRKNEYEADAFAADLGFSSSLIQALIKMSAHHLSNLYPSKIAVFMSYSHPTLLQRITHLKSQYNESVSTSP